MYGSNLSDNFDLITGAQEFESVSFGEEKMVAFDGHIVYLLNSKTVMSSLEPKLCPRIRHCQKKGLAWPMNCVHDVLIDNKLFNTPETVFFNCFLACKTYSNAKVFQQCANSVLWFIKQNHFMLALKSIDLLTQKLRRLPPTTRQQAQKTTKQVLRHCLPDHTSLSTESA